MFFWPSNSGILGVPKRSPNLAKMSAWSAWGIHVAGTTSERHRRSPDAPSNGSGPGPYRRDTQLSLQLAKPKRVTLNFSIFLGNYTDVTWPHLNRWFSRVNLHYLIKKHLPESYISKTLALNFQRPTRNRSLKIETPPRVWGGPIQKRCLSTSQHACHQKQIVWLQCFFFPWGV